jgi:hypothetical protein
MMNTGKETKETRRSICKQLDRKELFQMLPECYAKVE